MQSQQKEGIVMIGAGIMEYKIGRKAIEEMRKAMILKI